MDCPHGGSAATNERSDRTALGYRKFRCRQCGRGLNEPTGSPYNWLRYPTDIVFLVVLWRLRCLRAFWTANTSHSLAGLAR